MSTLFVEVLSGVSQGLAIPLLTHLVVGSDPQAGLVLGDAGIGGRHAEIALDKGQVWVRDCGSSGGTFLNGVRLGTQFVPVQGPARLRCASVELRVRGLGARPPSGRPARPGSGFVRGGRPPAKPPSGRPPLRKTPAPRGRPRPRPGSTRAPATRPPPGRADEVEVLANAVIDLTSGRCLGFKALSGEFGESDRNAVAASAANMFRGYRGLEGKLDKQRLPEDMFTTSRRAKYFLKTLPDQPVLFLLIASLNSDDDAAWRKLAEGMTKYAQLDVKPETGRQQAAPEGEVKLSATGFINLLELEKSDPGLLSAPIGTPGSSVQSPAPTPRKVSPAEPARALTPTERVALGKSLQEARTDAGYTVKAISNLVGVDRKEWALWERGVRMIPRRMHAAIIRNLPAAHQFL